MWGMSKRAVFSPRQNAALREALQNIETNYASQAALGEAIGVEQQTAGRLLRDDRAGFSFSTASRLVRLVGFEGVDAFFTAKGVGEVAELGDHAA